MPPSSPLAPGLTLRSLGAILFALFLTAFLVQFFGVTQVTERLYGTEALPVPAVTVFLALLIAGCIAKLLGSSQLFTRQEALCILYATLLAAPLMTHGFWRGMLSTVATLPRSGDFTNYDALPSHLWPHGPNRLEGAFNPESPLWVGSQGDLAWRDIELRDSGSVTVPVLGTDSSFRLRVGSPESPLSPSEPFLLSFLAHGTFTGAEARIYCRVLNPDGTVAREVVARRKGAEVTVLRPSGFRRTGIYAAKFSEISPDGTLSLEFGLAGEGTAMLADPELFSVSALETAYTGRQFVAAEDWENVPPEERHALVRGPTSWFSLDGLRFLVIGYVPWHAWWGPIATYGSLAAFFLLGSFAAVALMRRQWVQNERYPLPLAHVTRGLIEADEPKRWLPCGMFRNPAFWIGFGIAFVYSALRAWHAYNSAIPNVAISFNLRSFFPDPSFGETFADMRFSIYATFLGLALLMELNILLSLVLGTILFRAQHWLGEAYGLDSEAGYPYPQHQLGASYLAYALVVVLFSRRYLARILRDAWRGRQLHEEALSRRQGLALLLFSAAGAISVLALTGMSWHGAALFALLILAILVVTAKIRAEAGTPYTNFGPWNFTAFLPFLGGMSLFGVEGTLLAGFFLALAFTYGFFALPGLQLELVDLGRRYGVRRRHLLATAVLGIAGGLGIGGWVYLNSLYAIGATNYDMVGEFLGQGEPVKVLNAEVANANLALNPENQSNAPSSENSGPSAQTVATLGAAGATALVAVLRQIFAGFWFHPIGLVLAPTSQDPGMLNAVWGSLFAAWVIRLVVLRLGGAAAVRERLRPAAIGCFLAGVVTYLIFGAINAYIHFFAEGAQTFQGRL